jgi:FAD-dependent urate hydroxylase
MTDTDVAIIGAGPHGLAAATHLRRAGVDTRIFGDPMSFWRNMPAGMILRSNWQASCIAEQHGPHTLDEFCMDRRVSFHHPIPLHRFVEYGMWVQQRVAGDLDQRMVQSVEGDEGRFELRLSDGERLTARMVVVAAGIAAFANRPGYTAGLPAELTSHTSDHSDYGRFAGSRVLVVGGGQSALEAAALLTENGAETEVAMRADHLNWLHGGKYQRMLGGLAPLVYAPTDVGPMGVSRIIAAPDFFRRLPRGIQDPMAYRSIRPSGAKWLRTRLQDVPLAMNRTVASAIPAGDGVRVTFADGTTTTADHLLTGTGYRVDIARYPFLAQSLRDRIRRTQGYPILRPGLESSVDGLFFMGAPAAWSFGPVMRFVAGGWYCGRQVSRAVARRAESRPEVGLLPAASCA